MTEAKPKIPVYIAFPDGVFHYVCRECTQNCCYRSGEFDGSFDREMRHLVQLYPAMEITAVRRRGDVFGFATPSGRCYFLGEDARCLVETRHGKEAKPACCSLFPFNRYARIGKTFVTSLNLLCPVRLQVPAQPGKVEGTHAVIETQLRQSAYLNESYYHTTKQLYPFAETQAQAVVAEEISFRDLCAASLGRQRFITTLCHAAPAPKALDAFVHWAAPLLGLKSSLRPAQRDQTDDLLLAIAPIVRLNRLALSAEKRLRVLALSELALRRVLTLSAGQTAMLADASGPKGAIEILDRLGNVFHLLAIADEPASAVKNALKNIPPFGAAELMFAGYEILRAAEKGLPLAEVLQTTLPALPVVDRIALLMDLAHLVGTASPATQGKQAVRKAAAAGV